MAAASVKLIDDQEQAVTILGMALAEEELSPSAREMTRRQSGIVVTAVEWNSVAFLSGVRPGDVIVEADNRAVETLAELKQLMAGFLPWEPLYILFCSDSVWRLKVLFTEMHPRSRQRKGEVENQQTSG